MKVDSWVAGHLTGGIGNRLFQHAAAVGLAEKWSKPVVFYLPECSETNHGPFENIFKLFPRVIPIVEKENAVKLPEPNNCVFTYCPFPEKAVAEKTVIDGWRQSELYFPKQGIFPDFDSALSNKRLTELLEQYNLNSFEQKLSTWFLHVRLGDYKILPHHQIDFNQYYTKAMKHIPKDARVFLFSDEIEQFGKHLQDFFLGLGLQVTPVKLDDELETLYVMSQCWGGAVVANSTFSWWGSYFARKYHPKPSQYIAVYPSNWGKGLPIAKDIVPSWGIRIDN